MTPAANARAKQRRRAARIKRVVDPAFDAALIVSLVALVALVWTLSPIALKALATGVVVMLVAQQFSKGAAAVLRGGPAPAEPQGAPPDPTPEGPRVDRVDTGESAPED